MIFQGLDMHVQLFKERFDLPGRTAREIVIDNEHAAGRNRMIFSDRKGHRNRCSVCKDI